MARKEHCDRCDVVIGFGNENWPKQRATIHASFMADKGQPTENAEPVTLKVELTQFDGESRNAVVLCDGCLEDALDVFARQRVEQRQSRQAVVA